MGTSTPRKYLMMGTRSTLKIPTPRLKVDVFLVFLHFQTPERHHTLYTTSLYPRRPILASLTMGISWDTHTGADILLLVAYLCYDYTKLVQGNT